MMLSQLLSRQPFPCHPAIPASQYRDLSPTRSQMSSPECPGCVLQQQDLCDYQANACSSEEEMDFFLSARWTSR